MEDSKLWWYIILGVIYVVSKFLKKKKPENQPRPVSQNEQSERSTTQEPVEPKSPSSIEEILKELSEQANPEKEIVATPEPPKPGPIPHREAQPIETYSREPRPLPSQMHNIEAIEPDEEIDIVPHKPLEREKPVYERSQKFKIRENSNELADEIHDMFEEEEGVKKAFILGEVLNRKY